MSRQANQIVSRHARTQTARGSFESSELVTIAFLFTLTLSSLDANFLIVLLQCCEIFTGLTEFTLFHTFTHVPMHKGTLTVHEIELVVDTGEDFCNGCGVADHAASTHDLGQVTAWHHGRRLVVDATLEPGWRPIDKLNGPLGLNSSDRGIHIFGHHINTVHHAACHVLA